MARAVHGWGMVLAVWLSLALMLSGVVLSLFLPAYGIPVLVIGIALYAVLFFRLESDLGVAE